MSTSSLNEFNNDSTASPSHPPPQCAPGANGDGPSHAVSADTPAAAASSPANDLSPGAPLAQPPAIDLAAISRFPRHKFSRLPPDVRDAINRLIRQGVPFREIPLRLGPAGVTLNKNNISRWKKTGYALWLNQQLRREEALAQAQLVIDLLRENDNGKIHVATQQIAALKLCQLLSEFDVAALKDTLQQNPAALLRLLQTLPKLSQVGMECERLQLQLARRKLKLERESRPLSERGISEESLAEAERKLRLM